MDTKSFHHALKIDKELCIGCTHCMRVCPTKALRVKKGKAVLDPDKCVDCGECFRKCPVHAIYIEQDDFNEIYQYKHRVILVPSVFLGQFPEDITIGEIHGHLMRIGFDHVYEVEQSCDIIEESTNKYIKENKPNPAISTFCPAIIRLIQVHYPTLIRHITRIKTPVELSAMYYRQKLIDRGFDKSQIGIFYITPCAAKITSVKAPQFGDEASNITGVINMDFLYNKMRMSMNKRRLDEPVKELVTPKAIKWSLTGGENDNIKSRGIAVDGINNVVRFLERLENEDLPSLDFLELRACDESCAGGVLNHSNRFIVAERLKNRCMHLEQEEQIKDSPTIRDYEKLLKENISIMPIESRSIMQLDSDRKKALEKMLHVQEIMKELPKIDCGGCGCPSCKTLAKDIVQKKAKLHDCVFLQRIEYIKKNVSKEEQLKAIERVWGKKKFKK